MAVAMLLKAKEADQEFYDKVLEELNWKDEPWPQGFISHYAGPLPDGGWLVFDIWESQEDFERFAQERLMPAFETITGSATPPGGAEPKFIPVHNQDHAHATVTA